MSHYGCLYAVPPVLDPTIEIADPPKKRNPDDGYDISDYVEQDGYTEEDMRNILKSEINKCRKMTTKKKSFSQLQKKTSK